MPEDLERKLAAILAADIAGCSALLDANVDVIRDKGQRRAASS